MTKYRKGTIGNVVFIVFILAVLIGIPLLYVIPLYNIQEDPETFPVWSAEDKLNLDKRIQIEQLRTLYKIEEGINKKEQMTVDERREAARVQEEINNVAERVRNETQGH